MRRVFIVVGRSGSRKSSTIRALTGIGARNVIQIMQVDSTIIDVYAHHQSLQEAGITPDEFITRVEALEGNPDVLVALQIRRVRNPRFPNEQEYALQFEQAGWQIAGVAALGEPLDSLTDNAPESIPIPGSETMPPNQIASVIRPVWHWL